MKTITPIDLIKMNNEELYSIIESYIDDFEINTVIQTLAELNYRGYQSSIFTIEKYEKFLVKSITVDSVETAINK